MHWGPEEELAYKRQKTGLVSSADLLTIAQNKQEMKAQSTATPATSIHILPLLPTTGTGHSDKLQ